MSKHRCLALRAFAIIGTIWFACIGGALVSQAQTPQVVAGVPQDFYPEYALDAAGRPEGFAVDMMNAVAQRAGVNVTYRVFETWPDLIAALERGDADVIPVVAVTRARQQSMLFTRPTVSSTVALFVRQDADVRGLTDLADRRVAVIGGGVSAELLREGHPEARLVPYGHLTHALFDMLSGEVDALVSFESAVWKVAERARVADRIKVVGDPIAKSVRAIAVRQDLPALRDRMDDAVAKFLETPEYSDLYAKWYAMPPSFWTSGRIGWLAGVATAVLLLGMIVWQSLSLRAEGGQPAKAISAVLPSEGAAYPPCGHDVPRVCGFVALALGVAVLLGWAFDERLLKNVLPWAFAMQPWAATGIALAGGALFCLTTTGQQQKRAVLNVLASAVLIIGLLMILQHVAGVDLGVDRFLFSSAVGNQIGLAHPGRLAPATSIAFAALGMMLFLAKGERRWSRAVFSALGTMGLLLESAILVGYLMGVGTLQSVAFVTPIALHAALGLGVLFLGVLALRPDVGWIALLSGDRPGAVWVRMLLPVSVVGPMLLAWLFAVGARAGFYGPDFQVGLATLATVVLLVTSLLWSAVRVDRLDRSRLRSENALRRSEARLRHFIDAAPVAMAMFDRDMRYVAVSRRFITDYRLEGRELLGRSHYDIFPEVMDHWRAVHQRCLSGMTERSQGEQFVRANGRVDWIRWEVQPWYDSKDNVGGLVLFSEDISERKRAEDAVQESETRLRRTVEQAPFPIMVHAEDGEVVHLSHSWLALTGYSRADIGTVSDWTERAYGECGRVVRDEIDQLYALDGPVDEGEYVIRTADGGLRVWTFSSAPLGRDGRGRRLVVSMASDITARKEAERRLSESENRMRALLDASEDEILLLGIEGNVLAVNKAAQRRLARRTNIADLVGASLDRLLPLDQAESRLATARQVAATRTAQHCEVPTRSRWFEFWYYPSVQPDKPVTEIAIYAREITAQKHMLMELSKLHQAVAQSPMSVIITDRDGTIEYVNPEFTKVTGYPSEQAIGQNPRILKSGRNPPELYEELWRTITGGGVWRGELLNKKKNGELYWELASIGPVKDGKTITHFVAVKEDITARRETEDQLRQSQKMQAVGQLTGGIAHDFNNLLAIVIGNLQLLRERVRADDAKVREFLDDALWSAKRGGELTHRLLAFARKQPLKPAVLDVNDVVRGMGELLRRTLGARVQIEETLAAEAWKAFCDRGELERAIVNLAVNARDAMPTGGALTLETRNALLDEDYCEQYNDVTPGEYVLLAVTDTGSGMPAEVVERVFEPFFTTKEVGEGSGLGLSMVYGFIKQSGGHISIYSRVSQGTSVKLYLPRVPSTPDGAKDETPEVIAGDLGDHTVLVVEDERKLRKVAVKMLERLGLRSMQADNAKDALALLEAHNPDILFTDIELPGGMNGTDLAEVVRTRDPNILVLFTTGYAREAVLHERWREDNVPWLLKPYSHLDLARKLKALLRPMMHRPQA